MQTKGTDSMQNVRDLQKKTCLILTRTEFDEVIDSIYDGEVETHYSLDGISLNYTDDEREFSYDVLHNDLANYFDVNKVTSVHIDDCDYTGVWIVYKDSTSFSPYELIMCDGYNMSRYIYSNKESAQKAMRDQYDQYDNNEKNDNWDQMSQINDDSAILYSAGEDVYCWHIYRCKS